MVGIKKRHLLYSLMVSTCLLALSGCSNSHHLSQGYIEGRFTYVSSQNTGSLDVLATPRGTQVKFRQPLFRLDPEPQLAALNQAKEQLAQARSDLANLEKGKRPSEIAAIRAQQAQVYAQLVYSRKMLARYKKLFAKRVIPKSTLDQQQSNYNDLDARLSEITENLKTAQLGARSDEIKAARANMYAQEAAVNQAIWQLHQKIIYAPIGGVVYDTYYRIGETVPANHPILSILAPQNVYAVFFVPEEKFSTIKLGQTISITCDDCATKIAGKIFYISPEAEYTPPIIYSEKSRSKLVYRIEASLSRADARKLHPGQPITVSTNNKG